MGIRLPFIVGVTAWLLAFGVASPNATTSAGRQATAGGCLSQLSQYHAGHFDDALAPVSTDADVEAIYDCLASTGAGWIADGANGGDESRRRLAAASFALEVAARHLTLPRGSADALLQGVRWHQRLQELLVAWGGAVLSDRTPAFRAYADIERNPGARPLRAPASTNPVNPAEHAWFIAAAALLEQAMQNTLIPLPTGSPLREDEPVAYPLVPLALRRFPGDPAVLMAQATAEVKFGLPGGSVLVHLPLPELRRDLMSEPSALERAQSDLLRNALGRYESLTKIGAVAAEAHLRAGYIKLRQGDRKGARSHFTEADRLATDVFVRYVSRLLTGTAWQTDQRPADAEASYRLALDAAPKARSASTLLAALLVTTNRSADADALLNQAGPLNADPWIAFDDGDYRILPALLQRLRAQFQ